MKQIILFLTACIGILRCGNGDLGQKKQESKLEFFNGQICERKRYVDHEQRCSYFDGRAYCSPYPVERFETECYPSAQIWHIPHPANHQEICFYSRKLLFSKAVLSKAKPNLEDILSTDISLGFSESLSKKAVSVDSYGSAFNGLDLKSKEISLKQAEEDEKEAKEWLKHINWPLGLGTVAAVTSGSFFLWKGIQKIPYSSAGARNEKAFLILGTLGALTGFITYLTKEHNIRKLEWSNITKTTIFNKNSLAIQSEINSPAKLTDTLDIESEFMQTLFHVAQSGTGELCPDVQTAQDLFKKQNGL